MAVIVRVQAVWSGFQGAPGWTTWYGLSDGDAGAAANALAGRMHGLFDVCRGLLPNNTMVKVSRTYQVIDSVTGHIQAEANTATDRPVVDATGPAGYAAPSGAVINWETGAFNDAGHRLRGRTYLVPMAGAFDVDGTLTDAAFSGLVSAATACVGGLGNLVVYSRPRTYGGSDHPGEVNTVTSASVKDKACILRSRRD